MKICGMTRADDALAAAALGANAIGFIFWRHSPRFVEPEVAAAIVRRLPPLVTPVGVFVNEGAEEINRLVTAVGLGAIQLHGDERPDMVGDLTRPVIRALSGPAVGVEVDGWPSPTMVLIDAHDPVRRGGTGRTVDWTVAAQVARRRPILLSGGLTPANVADAIAAVQPHGIDVSSGVESAPGIKDHAKLAALFAQVRSGAVATGHTEVAR